jgi:hypothetical protein
VCTWNALLDGGGIRHVPYAWEPAARLAEDNGRGDWADALQSGFVGRTETEMTPHKDGTP